jgi:uncharacterized protein (DUF1684 family)
MSIDVADFEADWTAWHEARDEGLRAPHGWLSITAIHWLSDEPQRFEDVPGTWTGAPQCAVVVLGAGETLIVDGVELTEGEHRFDDLDDAGVTAEFGDALVQIADRQGSTILRPRHPSAPKRVSFTGTPAFPPSADWVVPGRFVRFAEPVETTVGSTKAGLENVFTSTGELEFEIAGETHRLLAFDDEDGLWVLFRDATSGVTTYGALRQLEVAWPDEGDRVVIDFNRALNMPCAYTDFATCPLPPAGNTLAVAVEAGEKTPWAHREAR